MTPPRLGPLRRIVERGLTEDQLECGHGYSHRRHVRAPGTIRPSGTVRATQTFSGDPQRWKTDQTVTRRRCPLCPRSKRAEYFNRRDAARRAEVSDAHAA